MRMTILAGLALAALAVPAAAQDGVGAEYMEMPVSTSDDAAKQAFLRGLALLHNFEYSRAAAAFHEAEAADPGFVMPYWGEAMSYNHSLWDEQDRDAALAALAKLGATPAERAAKARNATERLWLDAVEVLYGEGTKEERDLAYLARMKMVFDADPSDIDARAFYGLAILGSSHGGRQIPIYMEAAGVLEEGFMTHEHHPGILHYLIHSYDDSDHAPLGERAAARYARVAPDAGHAQHMVSHIFHALGDWEASQQANINAMAVVNRQRAAAGREVSYCGHYNEWLAYALMQRGKDAGEIVEGCRAQALSAIAAGSEGRLGGGIVASYTAIALWNGIATGTWPEPLGDLGDGYLLSRFDLAYGRMLEHFGEEAKVAADVAEMHSLAREITTAVAAEDPLNTWIMPWMERQVAQGDAVLVLSEGRSDEGLALLRAAAEAESAVPKVYGPPPMAKPSWELLGEQLLAMGRNEEAAEAFRHAIAFSPGRRISLAGLASATAN